MPTLKDHRGEAVSTADLKREHARATVAGVRTPHRDSVASRITPGRLARILRDADEGDTESFLILADEMEERELHYRSVLNTRKLSVTGRPVVVEAVSESPRDVEIADAVRDLVADPSFECLTFDALDGLGKGYSVVEILWDTTGARWKPRGYKHRDATFFRYDVETLSMLRLVDEADPVNGLDLAPFKYVVHVPKLKTGLPIRAGLARVAAAAYMLKSFTLRDWHAFMEVFGMPLRLGKYGQDATDAEKATLLQAVSSIAFDAAAIIPESMVIEFVEATKGSGGQTLFRDAADWWDRQVSKVVLGQTMTTDDGSSRAQAQVHDGVKDDYTRADCRQLAATINRDLVRPFVDLNWGPQEKYPYVRFQHDEAEDLESGARTVEILARSGLRIPTHWVRDKFGIPDPEGDEEVIGGKAPAPSPPTPEPEPPAPPEPPAQNSALNASRRADAIDDLVDASLSDWQPMLDGNVGALVRLAEQSGDFEQFKTLLARAQANGEFDTEEMTQALAVALFKARGLGDGTDKVS